MRTFTILERAHKGKQITVAKYQVSKSGSVEGVHIEVKHNVGAAPAGKQLRWVQTIYTNAPDITVCKSPHVVDPFGNWDPSMHKVSLPGVTSVCKADDVKPFYFTDSEFTTYGPGFSDTARWSKPAKGRYWFQFVLALTEVTGTNVHHLVAINWGYDRMADGSVRVAKVLRATMAQMKIHGATLKKFYSSYRFT